MAWLVKYVPDPKDMWQGGKQYYTVKGLTRDHMEGDPIYDALRSKLRQRQQHPEQAQYPVVAQQGAVPTFRVGAPTPAVAYQPVPTRPTDNHSTEHMSVIHRAEDPTFTAQGEPRAALDHPFQHIGYNLTHHPVDLLKQLFDYAKQGAGWIVWNYQDFYQQLRNWDGSLVGLTRSMGLFWRGLVVGLITLGLVETAPILEALATWLRLAFDFLTGALGLTGSLLEELWYLLEKIWVDVTRLWS